MDKLEVWTEEAVSTLPQTWKRESSCCLITIVKNLDSVSKRSVVQKPVGPRPIEATDCISTWYEKKWRDRDIAEAADKGSTRASGDCGLYQLRTGACPDSHGMRLSQSVVAEIKEAEIRHRECPIDNKFVAVGFVLKGQQTIPASNAERNPVSPRLERGPRHQSKWRTMSTGLIFANKSLGEVNIKEQRIAARISVFIVISRFGTDTGDYCRSKAYHWEAQ